MAVGIGGDDMRFKVVIIGLVIAIITVITMSKIYIDSKNCSEAGGALVRGIFWFKCIGGSK